MGLNNIVTLERLVDFANAGIVVTLALSFVFGGASIYLSKRLSTKKNEISQRQMQEANIKIEEAQEVAAKANKEAEQISHDNIILRKDLETATAETRSKQTELTIEQQKLATAQQHQAEAEQKRAETQLTLEKTLEEIRKKQMPRTLTSEQRSQFLSLLSNYTKGEIEIVCVLGDAEGYALATEIDGLLKAAQWKIIGDGVTQVVYTGGNPVGIGIIVKSVLTAPTYATILHKVFQNIGFPVGRMEDPTLPDGKVVLIVGNKNK